MTSGGVTAEMQRCIRKDEGNQRLLGGIDLRVLHATNATGGKDNVTAVIVDWQAPAPVE